MYKPISYRMRKGVHCHIEARPPFLVLDFPLKVVRLHPAWTATLDRLSSSPGMLLSEIEASMSSFPAGRVEAFLNDLVRKGFLEQEGISTLSEYPHVSVIIPVRNRPGEIKECIQSLLEVDYPRERLEIIVVDDASSDNTPRVAAGFPVRLICLKEHRQASFCRNLGARHAQGEVLAFIDSDCLADPLWLRELLPAFKDGSVGAVGGLVDSFSTERNLDRYERSKSSLVVSSWFKRSSDDEKFFYVPSCNLLVRRDLFLELGGFREDLHVGEDVDLCWRMQDTGCEVEYRPVGKVYHKHRNALFDFCSRRFEYGTSEPLLQKLHGKRKKYFLLPFWESLFWALIILSLYVGNPGILLLPSVSGLADTVIKRRRLICPAGAIPFACFAAARFRSYLAFSYHTCAFVSRYYLGFGFAVLALFPAVGAVAIGMHLLTAVLEYFIKRPDLGPSLFLFYFTAEQLSYQLGVWHGCLKTRHFGSVTPALLFGKGT